MLRNFGSQSIYRSLIVAAAFAAGTILASGAGAASISDNNSTMTINPSGSTNPFISQWIVDGVDQYGGSPAGGENLRFAIGSPGLVEQLNSLTVASSSFGSGIASITYQGSGFTVSVNEILSGGNSGSGASGISETIEVSNTQTPPPVIEGVTASPADGSATLVFSLLDNVNLNVNGTPGNDTLTLSPGSGTNTANQTDPSGAKVNFTVTPTPNLFEIIDATTGTPTSGLGPVTGDEAFAVQWNMSIAAGDSEIVSINETLSGGSTGSVVPLPNSAAATLAMLAGLGIIAIVRRMRRSAK